MKVEGGLFGGRKDLGWMREGNGESEYNWSI
jgi:hypothetical protein